MEQVILVNEKDVEIGVMEKMNAHRKGLLHRAFSVFIFNNKKELLIHKRAFNKYHSAGLWTNTCCSHPRPMENMIVAGRRRLQEEMGFDVPLKWYYSFIYKSKLDNNLTEHELDHVLIGFYNDKPLINRKEVADWKYISLEEIQNDININPSFYTEWLKIVIQKFTNENKWEQLIWS